MIVFGHCYGDLSVGVGETVVEVKNCFTSRAQPHRRIVALPEGGERLLDSVLQRDPDGELCEDPAFAGHQSGDTRNGL